VFVVYPLLKFWTSFTQIGGAILIAAVVPVAWMACAAFDTSAGTTDLAALWQSMADIFIRDWRIVSVIFGSQFLFSLFHEVVYGCQVLHSLFRKCSTLTPFFAQDTADDIEFGVFSMSILLGYSGTKRALMPTQLAFLVGLGFSFYSAGMHWLPLLVVPTYVLLAEGLRVRPSDSQSCGVYARRTIYLQVIIFLTACLDFAYIRYQSVA
jgi:4-hydroxybenzoate polyprenyltransferase